MDKAKWTKTAVVCGLAAGCCLLSAACVELAAIGAAALQAGLSGPSAEEKSKKYAPAWAAVAETLTPAQKAAVPSRLKRNTESVEHRDQPRSAWEQWKSYGRIKAGDYTPEVHAEVMRVLEEVRATKVQPCFQWSPPDLEQRWERRLAAADSVSTAPRLAGADGARGEALLEKFAAGRMPASWARYRQARKTAEELARVLREEFPEGAASDPTGGESHERTRAKAERAAGEMFRRHDELCFFFLMRKGGVFSDAMLKKLDDRGGAAWLEGESLNEGDAGIAELPVPGEEDAAFARERLPESWRACRELVPVYQAGAAHYRELRQIARALDAVRAEGQLALFGNRLAAIRVALEESYRQFGILRFQRRIGEADDAALAAKDRETAAALSALKEDTAPGRWFARAGKMGVLPLPGGGTMDMAWCPPGTFTMGSPATENGRGTNEAQRTVTIANGFWMAKCEVTREQWAGVMGSPAPEPGEALLPKTSRAGDDMGEFLTRSMLELPTEEEWEYACRAGNPGAYGGTGNLAEMGWFAGNGGGKLHPVGEKVPNAWGLFDMHGNVWEICGGEGAPIRGGSVHDRAEDCRSAFRDSLELRVRNKAERDMETMMRRLREEGIDEFDLRRGMERLPPGKREKLRKLHEEGVIVNPMTMGSAILGSVGFRPVFRE